MTAMNPIWHHQQAMEPSHWMAMLWLLVAMLCMVADQYALSANLQTASNRRLWRWCAALLLLLALADWMRAQDLLVLWLRDTARGEGWYALRRPVQLFALAIAVLAGLAAASRVLKTVSRGDSPAAQKTAILGMTLLLALLCVRLVSFHYTDQLLNTYLLGASLGRWIDLVGLLLIGAGAVLHLAHTYSYR